jgi:hypothetical protein
LYLFHVNAFDPIPSPFSWRVTFPNISFFHWSKDSLARFSYNLDHSSGCLHSLRLLNSNAKPSCPWFQHNQNRVSSMRTWRCFSSSTSLTLTDLRTAIDHISREVQDFPVPENIHVQTKKGYLTLCLQTFTGF